MVGLSRKQQSIGILLVSVLFACSETPIAAAESFPRRGVFEAAGGVSFSVPDFAENGVIRERNGTASVKISSESGGSAPVGVTALQFGAATGRTRVGGESPELPLFGNQARAIDRGGLPFQELMLPTERVLRRDIEGHRVDMYTVKILRSCVARLSA